jgi:hypothetical protein
VKRFLAVIACHAWLPLVRHAPHEAVAQTAVNRSLGVMMSAVVKLLRTAVLSHPLLRAVDLLDDVLHVIACLHGVRNTQTQEQIESNRIEPRQSL